MLLHVYMLCTYTYLFFAALELLKLAIDKAGYTGKIEIGMDVAASEFCKDKKYDLDFKNPKSDSSKWVINLQMCQVYFNVFTISVTFSTLVILCSKIYYRTTHLSIV